MGAAGDSRRAPFVPLLRFNFSHVLRRIVKKFA
jgi:hypothetical protein